MLSEIPWWNREDLASQWCWSVGDCLDSFMNYSARTVILLYANLYQATFRGLFMIWVVFLWNFSSKEVFFTRGFFPWACRPHVLNKMLYFIGYPGYLFLFCILLGRFSVAICCMAHLVSEVLFVCLFCFVGGVTDSVYFLLARCTLPIITHIIRFMIILVVVVWCTVHITFNERLWDQTHSYHTRVNLRPQ